MASDDQPKTRNVGRHDEAIEAQTTTEAATEASAGIRKLCSRCQMKSRREAMILAAQTNLQTMINAYTPVMFIVNTQPWRFIREANKRSNWIKAKRRSAR